MRLIIILIVLLAVGLLVYRQLNHISPMESETLDDNISIKAPAVPVKPQDVQKFGEQLNTFMEDAESERAKKIEQETQ